MSIYPTTQVVLDNIMTKEEFKRTYAPWGEKVIIMLETWKMHEWNAIRKDSNVEKRWIVIAKEIDRINKTISVDRQLQIAFEEGWMRDYMSPEAKEEIILNSHPRYERNHKRIILGGKPSIISALHEYGHHLLGSDELQACIFSISLFRIVFPKAYEKLNWNGHMLRM